MNPRSSCAGFSGQVVGTQASQKKVLQWAGPVRTLCPALSTATLKMCSANFQQQQYTPSKRFGDHYISNKKTVSRAASCKEVESWTHTVQKLACWLRESTAMQTAQCDGDRRAHLPQDRRGLLLHFLVQSHKTMLYWNYNSQDKQWNLMICVLRPSSFIAPCVALHRSQHLSYILPSSGIFHLLPNVILQLFLKHMIRR